MMNDREPRGFGNFAAYHCSGVWPCADERTILWFALKALQTDAAYALGMAASSDHPDEYACRALANLVNGLDPGEFQESP